MDYNTNQEVFLFCGTSSAVYDGDAMKHLQPVLFLMAPPYPY